ncbi:uncharacterized protein [Lolium perenne]|uniref:uncharacterized protein n=1 Tax=Lolium perenne TaxID=4522 RepID=UPI0021EA2D17|nr:remorin 1.4-like [Lolium perenne]XP_051193949.1 remorin 1.4-like [Lolium perenne]XP_051193950.1 remorin 1.4-like [Lolium perenne]
MRRSPRSTNSSSSASSLTQYDLYSYNASNARALLTCYTKAKPRPSKWDDAHKWLSRAPDGDHGRRRSSGANDRLLLPPASQKGVSRPSWTWSSVGGDVPAADAGALDDADTKRVVDSVRVSRQQRCAPLPLPLTLRDVGTEMTPAGSKEPSRTNTPRAALPTASRRSHVRVPANSPRKRDGGSLGGGAVDLGAPRESTEWRDPAAGARWTAVSPATAWDEAERAKHMARYRREELRIQAWENRERRKAELRMKTTEVTAERRMVRAQEKAAGKLAAAQAVAKEKRARAEAKLGRRAVKVGGGSPGFPSKLKLLSLKLPLLCS